MEYNKFYLYSQLATLLKHIIRSYYPGIIFGVIIFAMSVAPVSGEGQPLFFSFPGIDKVIHCMIYAIFTILMCWSYLRNNPLRWVRFGIFLFAILVYSIIIEIVQLSLTTYRYGEILDVIANMLGIILGAAAILLYRKLKY